jgi:hypothetical protein
LHLASTSIPLPSKDKQHFRINLPPFFAVEPQLTTTSIHDGSAQPTIDLQEPTHVRYQSRHRRLRTHTTEDFEVLFNQPASARQSTSLET